MYKTYSMILFDIFRVIYDRKTKKILLIEELRDNKEKNYGTSVPFFEWYTAGSFRIDRLLLTIQEILEKILVNNRREIDNKEFNWYHQIEIEIIEYQSKSKIGGRIHRKKKKKAANIH